MRLPRTLVFPFGYRVKVRVVTASAISELNEGEPVDGLWIDSVRTIFISKRMPMKRRRAVLIHEMFHALADFQHEMMDDGLAQN